MRVFPNYSIFTGSLCKKGKIYVMYSIFFHGIFCRKIILSIMLCPPLTMGGQCVQIINYDRWLSPSTYPCVGKKIFSRNSNKNRNFSRKAKFIIFVTHLLRRRKFFAKLLQKCVFVPTLTAPVHRGLRC